MKQKCLQQCYILSYLNIDCLKIAVKGTKRHHCSHIDLNFQNSNITRNTISETTQTIGKVFTMKTA